MPVRPRNVSAFLERSGWTQAQLAWELGVNQPRISRFIKGLKKPNPELDRALTRFFSDNPTARAIGQDEKPRAVIGARAFR
ncbi:helix-turn-helix transcriptional regulator [Methylobacterium durans]|uniref:helix-turn-helix transcriptional regulator n=1 Tax=Methylobacterium durans TaxID=2202825 RepID=UPI002AFF7A41|nr:helix-turn-helix transcriptional regulator [Methylobacterium durans]MEA1833629.1 helix-turn-helix transcriptional regulator [Methylobacterium durans]